jgi:hypothetical protein
MATTTDTWTTSIDCDKTISRLEEHLRGATEQLEKFKALRAPEVERGHRDHSNTVDYLKLTEEEAPILQRESIERRRAKNALISELKEAVEAAHNLPRDPIY